ncbi:thiamine transport system permease protein [Micrococcales bacterium KH10]|nr:thiamine transport system permease protein [Micrococcales bacterium KH10]
MLPVLGWTSTVLIPLAFIGIFFAWPVVTLIVRGFTADGAVDLTGFADVFSRTSTWRVIGQTLLQATLGTVGAVILGLPGAYVVSRLRFRGRAALRAWITVPFVLPTVVVGVAFRSLLGEGGPLAFLDWDQTLPAVVWALVFFNYAVVVRTVGALWERLDPRPVQAARVLGASPLRAFVTVTLPQLRPAIAAAASLVFLFCSTAFGIVMVLGGRRFANLEAEIYRQTTQLLDLRAAAVLSIAQLVIVSIALYVSSRLRTRRETALNLAAVATTSRRIQRADLPAVIVTGATITVLHVLPLASLVARSLRDAQGWGFGNYTALATQGSRDALTSTVWEALATSVRLALAATVIAMIIGLLLVTVLSRRPGKPLARRGIATIDGFVMLPLGVSAVTVGFGLLLTMYQPFGWDIDLRSSGVLIPIAQAVVAVPLVIRLVLPVVRAIDPRLRHAAAVLGASPVRVLATVDWPIAARSVGLATGFAMAASLGEFGATSFLVRPDSVTMPVIIFQLIGRQGAQNYGMALAAAVVLGLVTTIIIMAAERLRDAGAGEF